MTERTRGDFEVRVAAVKARPGDVASETSNRIFEATGARSTAEGPDRFRSLVRTHTLHDPVACTRREVGRRVLEGELPEPTWYS